MTRAKRVVMIFALLLVSLTFVWAGGQQEAAGPTGEAPSIPLPKGGHVEAVNQMPERELRIAFLTFQNNPFWFPVRDGAEAAKKYLANFNTKVDRIVMGDDLTADRVISAMEAAITKEYDAIAVVPIFDGTEIVINKAVDAGIVVSTYCAEGAKPSERLFFMGQQAYDAGQQCGMEIEKFTGGTGKVAPITGFFGAVQHELRLNGGLDYLRDNCPGITLLETLENRDKGEKAYEQTRDLLTAHSDIKAIYVTAGGPFGAAKAVQDLGLTGKVGVVCYDHIPENIQYVRSGEVVGCIDQDPFGMGFDSCVILHNYLITGKEPELLNGKTTYENRKLPVDCTMLTPENVDELYPE